MLTFKRSKQIKLKFVGQVDAFPNYIVFPFILLFRAPWQEYRQKKEMLIIIRVIRRFGKNDHNVLPHPLLLQPVQRFANTTNVQLLYDVFTSITAWAIFNLATYSTYLPI